MPKKGRKRHSLHGGLSRGIAPKKGRYGRREKNVLHALFTLAWPLLLADMFLFIERTKEVFHHRLLQWGGMVAILAGLFRGVTSFLPASDSMLFQLLYLVVDILLLLGLISIYLFQRKAIGWWGFAGFALALVGSALLIGKDVDRAGIFLYPLAALLFAVGISILGMRSWFAKTLSRWVVAAWIISTLLGIGYALLGSSVLLLLSGVLFSLGFIGAGCHVWLATNNPGNREPSSERRPRVVQRTDPR